MSYLVYVRHFLRPGAAGEFDEVFRLHRELVSKCEGFVSLRRFVPAAAGHVNEIVVLGELQGDEQLRAWRASEQHVLIAEKYRSLWARDPVTEFFTTPE